MASRISPANFSFYRREQRKQRDSNSLLSLLPPVHHPIPLSPAHSHFVGRVLGQTKGHIIDQEYTKAIEAKRVELSARYGNDVYDTQQLGETFEVRGFMAPFVTVIRKTDSVKDSLEFTGSPRLYYGFHAS